MSAGATAEPGSGVVSRQPGASAKTCTLRIQEPWFQSTGKLDFQVIGGQQVSTKVTYLGTNSVPFVGSNKSDVFVHRDLGSDQLGFKGPFQFTFPEGATGAKLVVTGTKTGVFAEAIIEPVADGERYAGRWPSEITITFKEELGVLTARIDSAISRTLSERGEDCLTATRGAGVDCWGSMTRENMTAALHYLRAAVSARLPGLEKKEGEFVDVVKQD